MRELQCRLRVINMSEQRKNINIIESSISKHRYGKKLSNNDYGTVAFLLDKRDILKDKRANAVSFSEKELTYNCIYFLIGHEVIGDNAVDKMYVGQAGIRDNGQSVLDRLNEHAWRGNDPKKYLDKWTDIIIVTNEKNSWQSTELDALEHIFWSLIPVGNRYNTAPVSSKGIDLSKFTEATRQIVEYIKYLDYPIFNKYSAESEPEESKTDIKDAVEKIQMAKANKPVDLDHGTSVVPNYTTPDFIVKEMLTALPSDVWNDSTVFLDPACKDGGYLKAIYRKLVVEIVNNKELFANKYDNNLDRVKNHVLSEQIYGIALNQNSRNITVNNLNGFGYNIRVIHDYIRNLKDNKSSNVLATMLDKEFNKKNMKIDVVIGNPPYNDDYTKVSTAIYTEFVENAFNIANKCSSFIIPSRWYASGRGIDKFRYKMLHENKLAKLVDFENSTQVFPNVNINGGVCYFLADNNNNELCELTKVNTDGTRIVNKVNIGKYDDIFVRDSRAYEIIDKIYNENIITLKYGVQVTDYFNVKDNPMVHGFRCNDSDIEIENVSGKTLYADRQALRDPNNLLDKYNVLVTHAIGSPKDVIPRTLKILDKGRACSVTYLCIGGTDYYNNAENLLKYIKTRFVRFLIKQAISGQGVSPKSFTFVPMQDFNNIDNQINLDEKDRIDWSQSITDIDKQLYKKYNLSLDDIAYIESQISSFDNAKQKITEQDLMANRVNMILNK
jgi:site-specific DNA-methyltransferase (adenine-specific)